MFKGTWLFSFIQLSRHVVQNINLAGGSFLGVSRGGAKISDIVDSIQVCIHSITLHIAKCPQ